MYCLQGTIRNPSSATKKKWMSVVEINSMSKLPAAEIAPLHLSSPFLGNLNHIYEESVTSSCTFSMFIFSQVYYLLQGKKIPGQDAQSIFVHPSLPHPSVNCLKNLTNFSKRVQVLTKPAKSLASKGFLLSISLLFSLIASLIIVRFGLRHWCLGCWTRCGFCYWLGIIGHVHWSSRFLTHPLKGQRGKQKTSFPIKTWSLPPFSGEFLSGSYPDQFFWFSFGLVSSLIISWSGQSCASFCFVPLLFPCCPVAPHVVMGQLAHRCLLLEV